jgi:hypothetical protein
MEEELPTKESEETVGAIAHKANNYIFDPSKEPLLRDNPRRFVIFPIEYPDIWQMYKKVCEKNNPYETNMFKHDFFVPFVCFCFCV